MKYFFIVVLHEKLFLSENKITLFRLLNLMHQSEIYEKIFTTWLNDIPAKYLGFMVSRLNEELTELLSLIHI